MTTSLDEPKHKSLKVDRRIYEELGALLLGTVILIFLMVFYVVMPLVG